MSTAANITVKKRDGTTNVVYGVISGASGQNPAIWKAPALGATPITQPEVRVISKNVPNTNKVKVIVTGMFPYSVVNSTTGVTSVEDRELFRLEYTGSNAIPTATRQESASQFMNWLASTDFRTMLDELAAAV